jgi:quercetin dioxygenase-like cupin family protein
LIDVESVGSRQLVVNEFTLKAGRRSYPGSHPCPFDEVYYVLRGRAWLILGADPPMRYRLTPGCIAFIPCGTTHALENTGRADLVLLTMMPRQPAPGVNSLYDARRKDWCTSFRLRRGARPVGGSREGRGRKDP